MSYRLRLFVLCATLCGGSLFGYEIRNPSLFDNGGDLGNFELSAAYLYMLPSIDDTYFVIRAQSDSDLPSGKRENNNFDFHSGFRIGAVYTPPACHQNFELYFTWLGATQKKTIDGAFLWATIGSPNFVFDSYPGSAYSRLNFLYERVDLLTTLPVSRCYNADISFQMGFEYAFLKLNEFQRYVEIGQTPSTLSVELKSRTWAIGPQLGFEVDCPFSHRCLEGLPGTLALKGATSGSILAGKSQQSNFQAQTGVGAINVSDADVWRVIPALHARLALSYSMCLACFDTVLEVGYEFDSYFNGLTRIVFDDDAADGHSSNSYNDFSVQGLYVSASIGF